MSGCNVTPLPRKELLNASSTRDVHKETSKEPDRAKAWQDVTSTSFLILCGASALSEVDTTVFGGCMKCLQNGIGFSIEDVGAVQSSRTLAWSLATPFWAILDARYDRRTLLIIACVTWAVLSVFSGMAHGKMIFVSMTVFSCMSISAVGPITQSLVPDFFDKESHSRAYAFLLAWNAFASMLVFRLITPLSMDAYEGVAGWRLSFIMVGCLSFIYGLCMIFGFETPERKGRINDSAQFTDMLMVTLRCPSWILIVLQQISGVVAFRALAFLPLWVQSTGHSAAYTGLILACFPLGRFLGALAAGWVGDWVYRTYPDNGRILCAFVSNALRFPVMFTLLIVCPTYKLSPYAYIASTISLGFLMPWVNIVCCKPFFAQLVPAQLRAGWFAAQLLMEGAVGSLGSFAVGFVAQKYYGYSDKADEGDTLENVAAISKALLWATFLPWALCGVFLILLLFTYTRDRDNT
eukprot:TRINITY_DN15104_c0_g2_i1.p1 TRINITY_DN15104_c0_g2~~TRINITY_DN15104_c0_g2_i1.p1  ORF type:complete len:465 (-),score=38.03 TRINITY_DN15104_c0_g2_i1:76-1470(-)